MNKIKVGVIFGGQSTEHDVSIVSGSSVIKNLNKDKYDIYPIYISKDGKWYHYDAEESPEIQKLLRDYEILQYGYYSDSDKDTMRKIFQIQK